MVGFFNIKNLILILFVSLYGCSGKPVDYRDSTQIPDEPGLFDLLFTKEKSVRSRFDDVKDSEAPNLIDDVEAFRAWKDKFRQGSELDQYKMWIQLREAAGGLDKQIFQ